MGTSALVCAPASCLVTVALRIICTTYHHYGAKDEWSQENCPARGVAPSFSTGRKRISRSFFTTFPYFFPFFVFGFPLFAEKEVKRGGVKTRQDPPLARRVRPSGAFGPCRPPARSRPPPPAGRWRSIGAWRGAASRAAAVLVRVWAGGGESRFASVRPRYAATGAGVLDVEQRVGFLMRGAAPSQASRCPSCAACLRAAPAEGSRPIKRHLQIPPSESITRWRVWNSGSR